MEQLHDPSCVRDRLKMAWIESRGETHRERERENEDSRRAKKRENFLSQFMTMMMIVGAAQVARANRGNSNHALANDDPVW